MLHSQNVSDNVFLKYLKALRVLEKRDLKGKKKKKRESGRLKDWKESGTAPGRSDKDEGPSQSQRKCYCIEYMSGWIFREVQRVLLIHYKPHLKRP